MYMHKLINATNEKDSADICTYQALAIQIVHETNTV